MRYGIFQGPLLCELGSSQRKDREFRQFAKIRMAAVMKEHAVYISSSQKCMNDGLKSLLGIQIQRFAPDLFGKIRNLERAMAVRCVIFYFGPNL
jgi:hypothetical protein